MQYGRLVVVAAGAVLAIQVGTAVAGIPATNGTIHGCYSPAGAKAGNGTQLNIVDSDSTTCSKGQVEVVWSQVGPKGDKGTTGDTGNSGADGKDGLDGAPGADGKDGLDGAPGPAGDFSGVFESPNGQFRLSVSDDGILLEGPDSELVIDASSIRIQAADSVAVYSGKDIDLLAADNLSAGAGANMRFSAGGRIHTDATGTFAVEASQVQLNGCVPIARIGDAVAGGSIVQGSTTFCAGN
jgi:hypothetical protein